VTILTPLLHKNMLKFISYFEIFEKCSFLFKFKESENFNHRCPAGNALGVNTLSISRIAI
jgi:hypothetical protein